MVNSVHWLHIQADDPQVSVGHTELSNRGIQIIRRPSMRGMNVMLPRHCKRFSGLRLSFESFLQGLAQTIGSSAARSSPATRLGSF